MTIVIEKKYITPLFIETTCYRDRFGSSNRYWEMNPSIWIKDDGNFIILLRTVNYLTYKDKTFQVYGDAARTEYYVINGNISKNFMEYDSVIPLNINYNIPRTHSLWYGVEDIRFIDSETILACIPECNNSSPCIFKGKLKDNMFHSLEKCLPYKNEKNWMPFYNGNRYQVIYSLSPFIIKSIENDDREEIKLKENLELDGWHGSSNGILIGENQVLFVIHKYKDKFYNKWLILNTNDLSVKISKDFLFFNNTFIEFVCSLSEYKERIFVSLGINDNKAFIVELEKYEIFKLI
jgi:hypothetical protein